MFEELQNADKIKMTHTGLIPGKNGKVIHVIFERETPEKRSYAELVLPSRKVLKNEGFEEEHIGISDVRIEKEILIRCLKSHKKIDKNINRACWRIPQKALA